MPNWIPALIAAGAALAESRSGRRNASPDGPLASLDPETRRRLLALKPDKLPGKGTDPSQYVIDLDNPCTNALITFRDKRWKQQKGYHQCYSQRGQRLKWLSTRFWAVRYVQILRHLRYVIKHSNPGGADWEAAVIALLIADSGVRPGTKGSKSLHARYGATTLERRHVSFDRHGAHLHFIGKGAKDNCYIVNDPVAVRALRQATARAPDDKSELFLQANENDVNKMLPEGITSKDLRTIRGSSLAARALEHTPSPLPGTKCTTVRKTFSDATKPVSTCLNNDASMARSNYIDPSVYHEWSTRNGWSDDACRATMKKAPNGQPWQLTGVWHDDAWMPKRSRLYAWWGGKR